MAGRLQTWPGLRDEGGLAPVQFPFATSTAVLGRRVQVRCPHCREWQTTSVFGHQTCFSCGRGFLVSRDEDCRRSVRSRRALRRAWVAVALLVGIGVLLSVAVPEAEPARGLGRWPLLSGLGMSGICWVAETVVGKKHKRGSRSGMGFFRTILLLAILAFALQDVFWLRPW